jgi:MFS family permease
MSKKQFAVLFLCNLVTWTVGAGLIPLLPVYAATLGAGPLLTGYYLAFVYAALTAGTVAAGWLSDALQHRKALLIVAGVVNVPATWLMGQATTIYQLAALTATVWFFGGMQLAMLGVLAGLFAEESERGKVFGILGMTVSLASLLAGSTMGSVADRRGYPTLLTVVALWYALFPLCALLLEDKMVVASRAGRGPTAGSASALGGRLYLLLLAELWAGTAYWVAILGRSLAMHGLGFSSAAIASTGIAMGAVSLPLVPLIGWLSDRVGRKRLIAFCYLAGAATLFVLSRSTSLWHFWLAFCLLSIPGRVSSPVGSALVTDLAPEQSLGAAMSLFQAAAWASGIIGFAGTGHAVERLGITSALVTAAFLPVIALVLLVPIRETRGRELRTA